MAPQACARCGQVFASRNALFAHLDDADHYEEAAGTPAAAPEARQQQPESPAFHSYYSQQLGLPKELWEHNCALLRSPLPHTLRGTTSSPFAARALAALRGLPGTELEALEGLQPC